MSTNDIQHVMFDSEMEEIYDKFPQTIRLAMEDFEHWALHDSRDSAVQKLVYMFNMTPHLLSIATHKSLQSYVKKTKGKFDSEATRKKFNGRMIKFNLLNTGIMVWTKITMTKKVVEYSSVSIAEAKSPGKYRNERGNLYIVRFDGRRFKSGKDYPADYTLLAVTGHALDRFVQRVGIEDRLTRDESIKVFATYLLNHPAKMILEDIDSEEAKERVKQATLFIDTHDGIIYLPGAICLLSDSRTDLKSNFMVCKTAMHNDNFLAKSLNQIRDFNLKPEVWNQPPTIKSYFTTVFNSEVNEKPITKEPYRRPIDL
jgi:hypothetical protein